MLEFLHVITALDFAELPEAWVLVRLGTWSPAAYLLPLGLALSLPQSRRNISPALFAIVLVGVAAGLMGLFAVVPRYSDPGVLGITRPTLMLAPLLWIPVIVGHWRIRGRDRVARSFSEPARGRHGSWPGSHCR